MASLAPEEIAKLQSLRDAMPAQEPIAVPDQDMNICERCGQAMESLKEVMEHKCK